MNKTLATYFDYKSPFAYVAKKAIYDFETEFGIEVDWRPYTLYIPDFLGSVDVNDKGEVVGGSRNEHQWRRVRYLYMDARRLAKPQGLVIRGPARVFDSTVSHIGMLFARREGVFRPYHDLAFERFWKRELDIDDPVAIEALLAELGADTAGFGAFLDGAGKQEHDGIVEDAHEKGIFGVPSFLIDGELFWGNEYLATVRERLAA
jgi:2-hydroxychromene-2-carboxylate isomerase